MSARSTRPVPAGQPIQAASLIHSAVTLTHAGITHSYLITRQLCQVVVCDTPTGTRAGDRETAAQQKERLRQAAVNAQQLADRLNQAHDEMTAAYGALDAAATGDES